MNNNKIYLINLCLLITCIVSRILTSIFYIEDIDSLRFALSLNEYDLSNLQPHFPGYFVYYILIKPIYEITSNIGISHSILGGISIYLCIIFVLKIFSITLYSKKGFYITLLIFFNPLMWLMSNRYMPDIAGLALVSISFYYINKQKIFKNIFCLGPITFGLLSGLRLSYIPFLLFPLVKNFFRNKSKIKFMSSIFVGISIWLIPLIYLTGMNDFIIIAKEHTFGHFYNYGGTIISNNNYIDRFLHLFFSIWADGMGGFIINRSSLTIIISIFLIIFFIGTIFARKKLLEINLFYTLLISIFIYIIWIYFFQNVIYKPRHVLPVVLFIIPMFVFSIFTLNKINKKLGNLILAIFLILQIILSFNLTIQHKEPSSISQVKDFIVSNNKISTIISIPLINYYLKNHGINKKFIDIEYDQINKKIKFNKEYNNILIIGRFEKLIEKENYYHQKDTIFFHNPYVNKMWSQISTAYFLLKNE